MIDVVFPRSVQVGFSVFVVGWAVATWAGYGPGNFLWFCDLGNLALVVALWAESAVLLSAVAVAVLLFQILFCVDLLVVIALGVHPFGGTEYVLDPATPPGLRLLALFHFAVPVLLVWGLRRTGYDRRGLAVALAAAVFVLPASFALGPETNVNWVWHPFGWEQDLVPPALFLVPVFAAYAVVYLSSHAAFGRLFPPAGRVSRPPPAAPPGGR